jgi:hypothetical protein
MRMIACDIASSGELHKLYAEYCRDKKLRLPTPDIWFSFFSDPNYFCLLFKHGRKQVGFVMGYVHRFYDKPVAKIEGVFIKRALRGKMKIGRRLVCDSKHYLKNSLKVQVLTYTREKAKERAL